MSTDKPQRSTRGTITPSVSRARRQAQIRASIVREMPATLSRSALLSRGLAEIVGRAELVSLVVTIAIRPRAVAWNLDMNFCDRRDREHALACCITDRQPDHCGQSLRPPPRTPPDPVRACIGEGQAERRAQQHDRVSEVELLGRCRADRQRSELRARSRGNELFPVSCFTKMHDIEPRTGIWTDCRPHKCDRQL